MIQDIFPKHMVCEYHDYSETESDAAVCIYNGRVLIKAEEEGEIVFPSLKEVREWGIKTLYPNRYLFSLDERHYVLCALSEECNPEGCGYKTLKEIRAMQPKHLVLAAATAWHLYNWYLDNVFCGRCGKELVHDTELRMLKCDCGNRVFPKISPAVIVGIVKGDSILITKYAGREYTKNALVAGFTEIGETAEETVAREVMEEVGLKVKNITYYKSQPWGFSGTLLMGYFCEACDDAPIKMDASELAEADWVRRDDLEEYTEGLSLTGDMMNYFREGKVSFSSKEKSVGKTAAKVVLRTLGVLALTVIILAAGLMSVLLVVNYGPSENAHKLFVKSVKETSAIGFLADWFTSPEELERIMNENTIEEPDAVTDTSLIHIGSDSQGENNPSDEKATGDLSDPNGANPDYAGGGQNGQSGGSHITPAATQGAGEVKPTDSVTEIPGAGDVTQALDNDPTSGGSAGTAGGAASESGEGASNGGGIGYDEKDVVTNENGIIICEISGTTYTGHMMIVEDPSRVTVGVCSGMGSPDVRGQKLSAIIDRYGAVAGINAGGFEDENGRGTGSIPYGYVFSEGQMLYDSGESSLLIGFDSNHILHVGNMDVATAAAKGIRDAVTFGPALIINGQAAAIKGTGSGLNPRTAIGQRSDGAVLMLVIDGRQANSLGASYADLIKVMQRFGAVNAANLDGGSSSLMLYKGASVSNPANLINNRSLPTAFIVK